MWVCQGFEYVRVRVWVEIGIYFFGDIIFYYDLVFVDEKVYIYHYSLG